MTDERRSVPPPPPPSPEVRATMAARFAQRNGTPAPAEPEPEPNGNGAYRDDEADRPPPEPPRLDVARVRDVFAAPPPEPAVLVEGLLRQGDFLGIASMRGIGKSFFAMNLALALARGHGLLAGRLPIRSRKRVLYNQGELDRYESYQRWYRMTTGDAPEDLVETFDPWRIKVVSRRSTDTIRDRDGSSTTSDESVEALLDPRLERAIEEHSLDVLVLDPWAVYYSGKENSNDEVEEALGRLRELTFAHGIAVVIVHHVSKALDVREPEDMWRGAGRLADWCTTRMTILPHYSANQAAEMGYTRQEARRFVDVKLLRRGAPTPDFSMRLDHASGWWVRWDPDPAEPKGGSGRPVAISPEDVAAKCREAGGWDSIARASADLGVAQATARKLLARAVSGGLLVEIPGPRNSIRYSLAVTPGDEGEDE